MRKGEKLKSAAVPESGEGRQYHIGVAPGEVSRYVLLPGDPERTDLIASFWDESRLVASHREYRTFTGHYKGAPISTTSTGIGAPSTAIALEELLRVGSDTFIRVGTMGSIQADVNVGDVVIAAGAVRMEGTSNYYAPPGYPAIAHPEVVMALIEAAEELGARYHVGILASSDSFYLGQGRPGFRGYSTPESRTLVERLQSMRVIGFEMEASVILTLSWIYGARGGAVCAVVANRVKDEFVVNAGVEEAIKVASEAVAKLYRWDKLKEEAGKKIVYPRLVAKL